MNGDGKEGDYVNLITSQLEYARKSNLLAFSRDKHIQTIAKKLKPEFSRVFFSTDVKESQKMIAVCNNDSIDPNKNEDASNIVKVDIVITEYDPTSAKLIDYILRRPYAPETTNCPLIPVIVLVTATNEADVRHHYSGYGGCIKYVRQGTSTKDLLLTMVEVLYGCRRVEDIFADVKTAIQMSSKYPYLPVFESIPIPTIKSADQEEEDSQTTTSSQNFANYQVDEIENASLGTVLVPDIVSKSPVRIAQKERDERLRMEAERENEEEIKRREDAEKEEMRRWRESQFKMLEAKDGKSEEERKKEQKEEEERITREKNFLVKKEINILDSQVARIDSVMMGNSQESTAFLPNDESSSPLPKTLHRPKSEKLLDPKCRPRLFEDISKHNDEDDVKYDLSNFINRPPPNIKRPLTVGGLDKKVAESYWKTLKNPTQEEASKMTKASFFRPNVSINGGRARSGSSDSGDLGKRRRSLGGDLATDSIDEHVQKTIQRLRLNNDHFTAALKAGGAPGSPSSRLTSPSHQHGVGSSGGGRRNNSIGQVSLMSAASWELNDFTSEEMKIANLAKKNPPDYQVANLLDIDFSHRKINLGEKDMLTRGLKLELQGDIKAAISCYTNAGAHSKDPQVSRMLLGNLHYRIGHLMTALKFYTVAISIIEMKPEALRLPLDQFLSHRNRAMINFRLGSDEEGIQDLEKAVKVNPQDIPTHELLSLAKRRVGKYNEAIDEAIISETHRHEKKKKDLLRAIEQAKLLKRIELGEDDDNDEFNEEDEEEDDDGDFDDMFDENGKLKPRKSSSKKKLKKLATSARKSIAHQSGNVLATLASTANNKLISRRTSKSDSSHNSRSSTRMSTREQQQEAANNVISSTTAAIALRREEYFKGLSQTKGLILNIPIAMSNSSLRSRIEEAKNNLKGDGNGLDEMNTEGGFLKNFKIKHNVKPDLFDELFLKPNPLQEALLYEPIKRAPKQIELILDSLKQFAFTNKLTSSNLHELASILEYRALHLKDNLFEQNDESAAMMFLIKGSIELKMDGSNQTGLLDIPIGNVKDFSVFGHMDLLFRHPRPSLKKAIEDAFLQSIEPTKLWDNSPMTLAANNLTNSSQTMNNGENGVNTVSTAGNNPNPAAAAATSAVPTNNGNNGFAPPPLEHRKTGGVASLANGNMNESVFSHDDGTNNMTTLDLIRQRSPENELFYRQINEFMTYWNKTEDITKLPRSLQPGMFLNYSMQTACELMMMNEKDFGRILYDHCVDEFILRLRGILASGIFKGWKPEDILRVARMGQVLTIKNGDTIIKQGNKPQYLYIILKGMCKVMKKPNRTEMLLQKLQIAEEKAEQHDLKYVFHHKVARGELDHGSTGGRSRSPSPPPPLLRPGSSGALSPILSPAPLSSSYPDGGTFSPIGDGNLSHNSSFRFTDMMSPPASPGHHQQQNTTGNNHPTTPNTPGNSNLFVTARRSTKKLKKGKLPFANAQAMKDFSTSVIMETPIPTDAEQIRIDTGQEIVKLKSLIHKAKLLDAMEQKNAFQKRMTRLQSVSMPSSAVSPSHNRHQPQTTHLGLKQDNRSEDAKMLDLAYTLGNKHAEIRILQWPMIFGEACVLDPENGASRGSILADTLCEVFAIHKSQLQTFMIDDSFLERVRGKAVVYPADPDMVVNLYRQQEWKEYRKEVLKKAASDATLKKLKESKNTKSATKVGGKH